MKLTVFAFLVILAAFGIATNDSVGLDSYESSYESNEASHDEASHDEAASEGDDTKKPSKQKPVNKIIWATSGGGWRALSSSMGFARGLSNTGVLQDKIGMISSVSGGSWFTLQLFYSQRFYQAVTNKTEPMQKVIKDWFGAYYKIGIHKNPKEFLENLLEDEDEIYNPTASHPALVQAKSRNGRLRWAKRAYKKAFRSGRRIVKSVRKKTKKAWRKTKKTIKKIIKDAKTIKKFAKSKVKKVLKKVKKFASKVVQKTKAFFNKIKNFFSALVREFPKWAEYFMVSKKYDFDWHRFINAVLESYTLGLSTMRVEERNRQNLHNVDMLINNVLPRNARTFQSMTVSKNANVMSVQGFSQSQNMFPLNYHVPASSGQSGWYFGSRKSLDTEVSYCNTKRVGFFEGKESYKKCHNSTLSYIPQLGALASFSSAAAGGLVMYEFLNKCLSRPLSLLLIHHSWGMGVQFGNHDIRVIDGGYIENTGTLGAIAQQQSIGQKRKLKILVLNSNACDAKTAKKYRHLGGCDFTNDVNMFWEGRPKEKKICKKGVCLGRLNPKIFNGKPPKSIKIGTDGFKYMHATATTIKNDEFGIAAGWEIEVLALAINAPVSTINNGVVGSKLYQELAADTEAAATMLYKKFPDFFA